MAKNKKFSLKKLLFGKHKSKSKSKYNVQIRFKDMYGNKRLESFTQKTRPKGKSMTIDHGVRAKIVKITKLK